MAPKDFELVCIFLGPSSAAVSKVKFGIFEKVDYYMGHYICPPPAPPESNLQLFVDVFYNRVMVRGGNFFQQHYREKP